MLMAASTATFLESLHYSFAIIERGNNAVIYLNWMKYCCALWLK